MKIKQFDIWIADLEPQRGTETGYGGDYSHAWGGSPLYFMSKNILGVKRAIPGYKEIEIRPFVSENISWAKGRVPLAEGNSIGIIWNKENKLKYIYTLEIPEDLRKRGFKINNKSYPKGTGRVQLISGTYEIEF